MTSFLKRCNGKLHFLLVILLFSVVILDRFNLTILFRGCINCYLLRLRAKLSLRDASEQAARRRLVSYIHLTQLMGLIEGPWLIMVDWMKAQRYCSCVSDKLKKEKGDLTL